MLEEADDVARAGEADADHARIAGAIDDVVDEAGLEAAVERDRAGPVKRHVARETSRGGSVGSVRTSRRCSALAGSTTG